MREIENRTSDFPLMHKKSIIKFIFLNIQRPRFNITSTIINCALNFHNIF